MLEINFKLIFAILSFAVGVISLVPYFLDIVRKKTTPHSFSWLIWSITLGTAAFAALSGGAGVGSIGIFGGTIAVAIVFLVSLKYGARNIRKIDVVFLAAALLAIFVWWRLENPILAVIMVTIIDFLGYFPTFRKIFEEPWSETISSWFLFSIANYFSILALEEYNLLTLPYLLTISTANLIVALICLLRRQKLPRPELVK